MSFLESRGKPEKSAMKGMSKGGQGCYHVKSSHSMVSKMLPTSEMKTLKLERLRDSQVNQVTELGFELK